jgi:diguanylate cyclase (GGDEF)-like protein
MNRSSILRPPPRDRAADVSSGGTALSPPRFVVASEELPGASKKIPIRALGFSLAAFATAALGAFSSPELLAGYDALSWLLLLVPVFLFAYYRGWRGSMRALAGGSLFVLTLEGAAGLLLGVKVEWVFLVLVALVLLAVGIGLGVLSELLRRERLQALALAYGDPLTGLPNRYLLSFVLEKAFAAARRGYPLSVVMLDVDGLGEYNSRYGYEAGDEALKLIAASVDKATRKMNTSGRYEGGTFLSILSGVPRDGAWVFTERLREAIEQVELPTDARLTVSCGVASSNGLIGGPEDRVAAAEMALARAKALGGNCSVCEGAN